MRTINPGLFFSLALLTVGACDVGSVVDRPPGQDLDTPDAGDELGPDASELACEEPVQNVGSGNHNPGQPCMMCHSPAGPGPNWKLAGTVYTDAAGTDPVVGATIVVIDANGTRFELPTATNGNFYTPQNVAFPVTVEASKCPDSNPMIAQSATGDCNSGGCHSAGSTSGRIHLP
jgi:hypothetical protein